MAAGRQCALLRNLFQSNKNWCHIFSTSGRNQSYHYKLVVLGGGTGGSAVANKYAKKLGVGNVAVIEPSEVRTVHLCLFFDPRILFSILISTRC